VEEEMEIETQSKKVASSSDDWDDETFTEVKKEIF
jgi:hypothetical protein